MTIHLGVRLPLFFGGLDSYRCRSLEVGFQRTCHGLVPQVPRTKWPTFPKWCANRRQDRLKLPSGQAFFSLRGACGRANARSWAIRPVNPQHIGPAAVFFSSAGRPILPFSFSLGLDHGHAPDDSCEDGAHYRADDGILRQTQMEADILPSPSLYSDSIPPPLPRTSALRRLRRTARPFLFQRNINVFVD